MDKRRCGAGQGYRTSSKCRSCSVSTTTRLTTIGQASRPGRVGLASVSRGGRPKRGAKSSGTFAPAISPECRMVHDRSRLSPAPCGALYRPAVKPRPLSLQQAEVAQACMRAATDDQMVVHGHAERMGGLDDVSGDGDVRRVTKKPGSESNNHAPFPSAAEA